MRARGTVVALVALAAGALTPVPALATRASLPSICQNEVNAAQRMHADVSALASDGVLLLDGRSIVVSGPDAEWRQHVTGNQTFTTRFHSLAWLVEAARQGFPAVDLVLERDAALPDPGSTASAVALQSTGWTEGAVRLRMGVVNCLYSYTDDERLIPVMERLVLAGADPYRYRGGPLKRVHNHGTLANIMLAESAKTFGRDDWWQLAMRRFAADASDVFSECGMSGEQSSAYQLLNWQLWERSLKLLEEGGSQVAGVVRTALDRAALATLQLARPDGVLEAIGDGNQSAVLPSTLGIDTSAASTRLWCTGRGWAANRSSWDDTATHYTLRFGPRVAMHGHDDHGSLTWFTQGVPVFSDRGLYDKTRGPRYDWARSMRAHTSFEPVGVDTRGEMRARDLTRGRTDAYRLTWREDRVSLTRDVTIPLDPAYLPIVVDDTSSDDTTAVPEPIALAPATSLRVVDTGRSRHSQQWMQNWQLAEGWTPLSTPSPWDPIAVNDAAGLYLYGSCHSGLDMNPAVRDVESFPEWRTVVPSTAFICGGLDRVVTMDTLWVVTPLLGTLSRNRVTGGYSITPLPPLPRS